MKPIREVYPDREDGDYGPVDYQPMLDSFGHDILLQVDDRDYQGDSRLILRDGQRIGYLNFGWGSCSGCDALQATETYAGLDELRSKIYSGTQWFSGPFEALNFFETHDWEADYSWHEDEQKQFISAAKELLRGMAP